MSKKLIIWVLVLLFSLWGWGLVFFSYPQYEARLILTSEVPTQVFKKISAYKNDLANSINKQPLMVVLLINPAEQFLPNLNAVTIRIILWLIYILALGLAGFFIIIEPHSIEPVDQDDSKDIITTLPYNPWHSKMSEELKPIYELLYSHNINTLLISSAKPKTGKTFLSRHLAAYLAGPGGYKVLLVELSGIKQIFNIKAKVKVSRSIPRLHLLVWKKQLFKKNSLESVIRELQLKYDYILIDGPVYANYLKKFLPYPLILVSAPVSKIKQIPHIGVVINNINNRK